MQRPNERFAFWGLVDAFIQPWLASGTKRTERQDLETGGDGENDVALDIELDQDMENRQREANLRFVQHYKAYISQHKKAETDDLYCNMCYTHGLISPATEAASAGWWWMPYDHPVAWILRNTKVVPFRVVNDELLGQLVVYNNCDVESCVLDIAEWFADYNAEFGHKNGTDTQMQ